LLTIAERILNEASNVRRLADLFTNDASGVLTIATTHTQARYSLPPVIKAFRELFPDVRLELIQGTPQEIEVLLQRWGGYRHCQRTPEQRPAAGGFPGSAGTTACYSRSIIR
jgi:hypothetical protein